ncbi:MAG: DegV family protein [Clostridia bacterium]|nr:DegV family protein [Clostridia bacterium]
MADFAIFTDLGADLSETMARELGVEVLAQAFRLDDVEIRKPFHTEEECAAFFGKLRAGSMSVTSQINPEDFIEAFTPVLESGRDVLCMPMSSGISGTYNSAVNAQTELRERFPERQIEVVDTLSACLGQGLLIYLTSRFAKEGHTLEETAAFANETKMRVNHIFTVDDLNFLKRGGRLSGSSALLGSLLHIKPVMYANNEGKLIVRDKVAMRRRAIRAMADSIKQRGIDVENQTVFIAHADASDDCDAVIAGIRGHFPDVEIIKGPLGPVIGSHSGPGTLALFFLGKDREAAV